MFNCYKRQIMDIIRQNLHNPLKMQKSSYIFKKGKKIICKIINAKLSNNFTKHELLLQRGKKIETQNYDKYEGNNNNRRIEKRLIKAAYHSP